MTNAMLPRRTILTLLAAAPVAAHAQTAPALDVIVSFTILADLARAIGGSQIRVTSLVGPNQDAHAYQPRPSDARAVAAAKVMIVNGFGFEGWVERLASSAGFKGVPVVATTGVKALRGGHTGHTHGGQSHGGGNNVDPHAWQDVANTKTYVANIRDGLIKADPANAARYTAATQAYIAQLDRLDAEIRAAWAAIPRANRRIVTSHDAFTYYGDAYGVDLFAPQGISTESDPTPRQLAALIAQIKSEKVRALFVESIGNAQVLQQVARETGARIGPAVFSDALSGAAGPAPSYLDMMRHNTRSFVSALR